MSLLSTLPVYYRLDHCLPRASNDALHVYMPRMNTALGIIPTADRPGYC